MNDVLIYGLILLITKIVSELFKRIKLPSVIGVIIAGVLCGPVFHLFEISQTLDFLANIGILFLLFIAGLETNIEQMKQQGKHSMIAAVLGVSVPFGLAFIFMFLNYDFTTTYTIGLTLTATSVSITVMTLMELKSLNTRSGVTVLGSAVIDDVIAIILMTISLVFLMHTGNLVMTIVKLAGFFVFSMIFYIFLSDPFMNIARRFKSSESLAGIAVIIMLLMGVFSHSLGIAAITGAYIAGVAIAKTPYRRKIISKVSTITDTLFISIFFFVVGMKTSIDMHHIDIGFTLLYVFLAVAGKILGSGLGVFASGLTMREAMKVGFGMIPRGEVALVIAAIGFDNALISQSIFNSVVIMILFTSILTPIALKFLYKKNI
ncbi:MAG: cation:proton antiporter [bacterium]